MNEKDLWVIDNLNQQKAAIIARAEWSLSKADEAELKSLDEQIKAIDPSKVEAVKATKKPATKKPVAKKAPAKKK